MKITGLLIRGIGVHHAGLLQILKELVEILFSDGYLKVVFATSTFAIGLNLPARCVMFTGMRKFNGTENATIEASEYLQMAGRAGRRGKDDRGFSVICADPDLGSSIPSKTEMIDLLDSKGVELASQLRIDYRTCMNVLK
jgi:ATP-dependent RNA helicase DOB1